MLTQQTGIKNLGHDTPELNIPQSWSSRIQTYVRKFNPAISIKHKWLSDCAERSALLGLPSKHKIIIDPALPNESATSHHCIPHILPECITAKSVCHLTAYLHVKNTNYQIYVCAKKHSQHTSLA